MILRVLQAEVDDVAQLELEIVDGLLRQEGAIVLTGQFLHGAFGVVAGEEGVGEISRVADGKWIDAIEVLQIVPDIGEAVHHPPRCTNPGHLADAIE